MRIVLLADVGVIQAFNEPVCLQQLSIAQLTVGVQDLLALSYVPGCTTPCLR